MAAAGVSSSATQFAHQFNLRLPRRNITIHGARRWLKGESIPTQDRLQILADWLGVSAAWLRFGDTLEMSSDRTMGPGQLTGADSTMLGDFHRLSADGKTLVTELIKPLLDVQKQSQKK